MNLITAFLLPFFIGIIAILFLKKISEKTGFLVDIAQGDILKIHTKKIPLVGGLGIALVFLAGIIFWAESQWLNVFLAFLPVFLLGFYDDLKWKHVSTIKPLLKFGLLIICTFIPAVILLFTGISFNFVPVPAIAVFLGFVFIFVSINAINYQDGMDGLAGGLAAISLLGFIVIGGAMGNSFALVLSVITLGAVTAFLLFNFPPARIFMGDSGAYSLGFILAVLVMLFSKPYDIFSVIGPIFIIGLPIFDGVYTNIRRLATGKSIFHGDRSHFYDKLLQKGFSTQKTLAICYGLQAALAGAGVLTYIYKVL